MTQTERHGAEHGTREGMGIAPRAVEEGSKGEIAMATKVEMWLRRRGLRVLKPHAPTLQPLYFLECVGCQAPGKENRGRSGGLLGGFIQKPGKTTPFWAMPIHGLLGTRPILPSSHPPCAAPGPVLQGGVRQLLESMGVVKWSRPGGSVG